MKYISSIHSESERYINKTVLCPYANKSDMEEISLSNLRKRGMQWRKYHHLSIIYYIKEILTNTFIPN
jgi:hypothetical protein